MEIRIKFDIKQIYLEDLVVGDAFRVASDPVAHLMIVCAIPDPDRIKYSPPKETL